MSELQETLSKDDQFNYHLRDLGGISYGIEENNNFQNELSPSYDKEEFDFNLLQPDNINQQNQFDEFRLLLQDEDHANKIKIIPVKTVDEVLKVALTKSLTPIDWVEIDLSQTQKGKELSSERPVN